MTHKESHARQRRISSVRVKVLQKGVEWPWMNGNLRGHLAERVAREGDLFAFELLFITIVASPGSKLEGRVDGM